MQFADERCEDSRGFNEGRFLLKDLKSNGRMHCPFQIRSGVDLFVYSLLFENPASATCSFFIGSLIGKAYE